LKKKKISEKQEEGNCSRKKAELKHKVRRKVETPFKELFQAPTVEEYRSKMVQGGVEGPREKKKFLSDALVPLVESSAVEKGGGERRIEGKE